MTEIRSIIIDTDSDGGCGITRAVVIRRNRRTFAYADGVWYLPGSFTPLTEQQVAEIQAAEERAI